MPVHGIVVASRSEAQFFDVNQEVADIVRQAIERVRPWMAKYVQSQLDWSVSENDFTDRIVRRLSAAHEKEPFLDAAAPTLAEEAVKESLRFLVHEEKRSTYRKPLIPLEESTPDPKSALFLSELETESRAKEILSHVPKDLLPVVKSLYGLYGEEELSARAIAKKLGIKEDSLRQKLCRLRADLRQKLGKNF